MERRRLQHLPVTLIRGLEVSLGLEVDEDPNNSLRNWPVDFIWICGAPKFEGWVSWRTHDATGFVTILMVTPSIGDDVAGNYNSGISLSITQGIGTVQGTQGLRGDRRLEPDTPAADTHATAGIRALGDRAPVLSGRGPSRRFPLQAIAGWRLARR